MKQSHQNYQAWNISDQPYPQGGDKRSQIEYLLGYAVLAPSTFNAQPWRVHVTAEGIDVAIDYERLPIQSDKSGRFGLISIGCFIAGLEIAAQHFGWQTEVLYSRETTFSSIGIVASVAIKKRVVKNADDSQDLFQRISQRATNRSYHQPKPLPKSLNARLDAILLPEVEQRLLQPADWQARVMNLSKDADIAIWSDINFRREHVSWVRHNFTRQPDGMPGFGVGISNLASLLAKPMILSPAFAKLQTAKNQRALARSNGYIVFLADEKRSGWLNVGRSFMKVSLATWGMGISLAPMGQFIEHEQTRTALHQLIGGGVNPPQLFARIGYPTKSVPHSPRRNVADILY